MLKKRFSKSNKSKSIYDRSFLSSGNDTMLCIYSKIVIIGLIVVFVFSVLIEICKCNISWHCFLCFFYKPIKEFVCKNHFSILSIVVTLLSVIMATFSIAFGNFKICNINANLVLKQIYSGSKKNLYTIILIILMIAPFFMIISQIFHWEFLFFTTFITAFFNLFLMLDICLTIFTDNGVKYVEIPANISRELQQTVCRDLDDNEFSYGNRERLLYDSFIQGIRCEDYSVNRIVVPSIVLKNMKLEYTVEYHEKKCHKKDKDNAAAERKVCSVYKITYRLFRDIRKYLYRNTPDFSDFTETYFGLCYNTMIAVIYEHLKDETKQKDGKKNLKDETKQKDGKKDRKEEFWMDYCAVFLAIFRNLTEIVYMDEMQESTAVYSSEMMKILSKKNGRKDVFSPLPDGDDGGKIRIVLWLLIMIQTEYVLSEKDSEKSIAPNVYADMSRVIEKLFRETLILLLDFIRKQNDPIEIDMAAVGSVMKDAKILFCQLSCGILDTAFEKTYNLNYLYTVKSAENIVYDMESYLKARTNLDNGEKEYLRSNFCFIHKSIQKGGSEK